MSVIDLTIGGLAPTVVNLEAGIAIEGPQGLPGSDGADGTDGRTTLSGAGAPASITGSDGDFYIDTSGKTIYGPKTTGAWGSPTNLIGPAGTGSGDMIASVYDPTSKAANAFSMDNMVEGTSTKIMTALERTKLDGIAVGAEVNTIEAGEGLAALDSAAATKLAGISAGANVTDTASVTAAGAFMKVTDDLDDLTEGLTNKHYTATDKTKLAGVETSADRTDAENVNISGAAMNTDTSTAEMLFVVDEDNMVSNSNTKVPTQQSVKAYVDANSGAGGDVTGPTGSATNEIAIYADATGKVIKRGTNLTYTEATGSLYRATGATLEASATGEAALKSGAAKLAVSQGAGAVLTGVGLSARINPRNTGFASLTTPDVSLIDTYSYHILSVNITIAAPIGGPKTGNKLLFAFKDDGTSRVLTWNPIFEPIGVTLPTATTPNKWIYVGAVYNQVVVAWHVIAVTTEV